MNMTFPRFPWTHCRRSFAAMCWRWRNPRRPLWIWLRWWLWALCPCAARENTSSGAMRTGQNLSTPTRSSSFPRQSQRKQYPPAEGCCPGRMPPVRKAHSPSEGQKGQILLFRPMPKCMVERPPGEGAAESLLLSDLRILRKGVYQLWQPET